MLLAILLSLTSTSSAPILGALGRPAQAWFLSQVGLHHSGLSQSLHDAKGNKPYTVSTLIDRNGRPLKPGSMLKEGEECWLRITTLNEELSKVMQESILKKLPKRLDIYKMTFRIDGYTLNPHEHVWAGMTSFAEMAQENLYGKVPHNVRMEFVSPTAFRNNNNDIALPAPGQVFRSLWQKWNAFCPASMQLQDIWPDFVNDCILVDELTNVNTVYWEFAERTRGAATGFTGTVGFTLLPKAKVKEKWLPYWDGADVVMQSLAHYSFYCGVGHHSTIGMGQSKALVHR